MTEKKYKIIIDTDPGVDDSACFVYALSDKQLDIKLITTVSGNVGVEVATRNMLHLLDKFNKDIPVAEGARQAMQRLTPHAEHIHSQEGMGGYLPPKQTHRKIIQEEGCEAMYRVLKEGDGDIIPILLGPQTNMALLLTRHPDIKEKIPRIIFMGGAPFGIEGNPDYISFNISSDPEAFKIVVDSKIPLVMISSDMGRQKAYLDENYVLNKVKGVNEVGNFLFAMYDKYWEPGFKDRRIAINDSCAYMFLIHPEIFTTQQIDIAVDLGDRPGKIDAHFNQEGHCTLATGVNRDKLLDYLYKKLKEFDNVEFN